MKFIMKLFPFLFIFLILFSCKNNEETKIINSSTYSNYIEKANAKVSILELDSAFYYFNQAKLACSINEKEQKIFALISMAEIQKTNCDFVGLEETATEALSIYNETIYKEYLYNYLGIAFNEQSDYENALLFYNKTYLSSNNEINQLTIKNNIAVNYLEQKEFTKSIVILEQLIKNDSLNVYPREFARVTDNLGFSYFKIKKDSLAKHFLETSLKIRDSLNNDYDKIASHIHLSRFYEFKNPQLAKEFAEKALQFATNVNSPDDKLEALDLLIKNSTNTNSIKDFEKFSFINDSISKIRQAAKNQFAKIKYDSKLAIESSEKHKVQRDNLFLIFISFAIISVLIYFLIRSKNKRKLQRASYETETRISKQLHDELANDVFNVMNLAQSHDFTNSDKKEDFINQLETIYNRTRNISIENNEIETNENYKENLINLISSFNCENINVIIKNSDLIDWNKVKKLSKIAIYRSIQELLVNMKKHSQCSIAVISFESNDKTYQIKYTDNGIGVPKTIKFKNGLKNMENRIKTIKGTIIFETEIQKGFKVKITFPK